MSDASARGSDAPERVGQRRSKYGQTYVSDGTSQEPVGVAFAVCVHLTPAPIATPHTWNRQFAQHSTSFGGNLIGAG